MLRYSTVPNIDFLLFLLFIATFIIIKNDVYSTLISTSLVKKFIAGIFNVFIIALVFYYYG